MLLALIKITLVSGVCILTLSMLIPSNIKQKLILFCFILCLLSPFISQSPLSLNVYSVIPTYLNNANNTPIKLTNHIESQDNILSKTSTTQNYTNNSLKPNQMDITLTQILMVIWLCGVLFKSIQSTNQIIQILTIIKNSNPFQYPDFKDYHHINKKVHFRTSKKTSVPFLFVTLKSIEIILPVEVKYWSKYKVSNITSHELCHYRRKDHWALWFTTFVEIVFWFHPFILKLCKSHKQLIELACDQRLLSEGVDPSIYAETILSFPQNKTNIKMVASMSTKPSLLKKRIHGILNQQSKKISFSRFPALLITILFILLTACVNDNILLTNNNIIKFISNDLSSFRTGTLPNGRIHIATFYDGADTNNTYLEIELGQTNSKQTTWLTLGPLKKFNDQIQSWEYKTINDGYLTGNYKIKGVIADGSVDGVAVGIIHANNQGHLNIHKSSGPIDDGYPNLICSWPLSLDDELLIKYSPQLTSNNIETINRLLCGAQLVKDGDYSFRNF